MIKAGTVIEIAQGNTPLGQCLVLGDLSVYVPPELQPLIGALGSGLAGDASALVEKLERDPSLDVRLRMLRGRES